MPDKQSQAQAVQNAAAASHDIQVLAAGLGVSVSQLIRCLVGAVGIVKLLQCLRSGDFFACLLENVDFAKIIDCALGMLPGEGGGTGGEFDAK